MHFQCKHSIVIESGWSQIESLQHACACWCASEPPLPTQRSRFGLFCITWTLLKVWFPLQPAAWKVDALHRGTPGNVLTVLPRGTSCIFGHYAHCTLWVFPIARSRSRTCGRAPWGSMEGRCPSRGWQSHLSNGERPWIYCTRWLIRMFNPPALETHTHTHARTHHLPLQCMQGDPDLMELEWDRARERGRGRQGERVYLIRGETGRGLSDIISMSTPLPTPIQFTVKSSIW